MSIDGLMPPDLVKCAEEIAEHLPGPAHEFEGPARIIGGQRQAVFKEETDLTRPAENVSICQALAEPNRFVAERAAQRLVRRSRHRAGRLPRPCQERGSANAPKE
jgi:hypothetical protein